MADIQHVDDRKFAFFMLDNEVIDNYILSADADSMYMTIVRRAQHKKTSFPSIRRWMKEKKKGHEKAREALNELVEKKLIRIDGRQRPGGAYIYRILPVKKGVPTSGTGKPNPFPRQEQGASEAGTGGVPRARTEEYKDNNTKIIIHKDRSKLSWEDGGKGKRPDLQAFIASGATEKQITMLKERIKREDAEHGV